MMNDDDDQNVVENVTGHRQEEPDEVSEGLMTGLLASSTSTSTSTSSDNHEERKEQLTTVLPISSPADTGACTDINTSTHPSSSSSSSSSSTILNNSDDTDTANANDNTANTANEPSDRNILQLGKEEEEEERTIIIIASAEKEKDESGVVGVVEKEEQKDCDNKEEKEKEEVVHEHHHKNDHGGKEEEVHHHHSNDLPQASTAAPAQGTNNTQLLQETTDEMGATTMAIAATAATATAKDSSTIMTLKDYHLKKKEEEVLSPLLENESENRQPSNATTTGTITKSNDAIHNDDKIAKGTETYDHPSRFETISTLAKPTRRLNNNINNNTHNTLDDSSSPTSSQHHLSQTLSFFQNSIVPSAPSSAPSPSKQKQKHKLQMHSPTTIGFQNQQRTNNLKLNNDTSIVSSKRRTTTTKLSPVNSSSRNNYNNNNIARGGFKSFLSGRRLLWSLALVYVVLLILSFVHSSILLESSSSSSSSTKRNNKKIPSSPLQQGGIMTKRLAEFSKSTVITHKRPNYDPHNKTLALLYPLGIIGGYRNQVIRFISFVRQAKNNNITQMLLPSIVWSTTHVEAKDRKRFFPVPMDLLFDIDHWNSFHKELPILVDTVKDSDCWGLHDPKKYRLPERTPTQYISALSQKVLDENALLTPVVNYTRSLLTGELKIRPRQFNLFPMVHNCTHPIVYGGGKGGGKLWNDYVSMPKLGIRNKVTAEATENSRVISVINQALTPNRQWREVAHQCVLQHQLQDKTAGAGGGQFNYVALHARIETDMMAHKCGRTMQKNLTNIFHMVEDLVERYNVDKDANDHMKGIFIAVSRQGMRNPVNNTELQEMTNYNMEVLLERSVTEHPNRKPDGRLDIFECGEMWTDRWYRSQDDIEHDYYGSILPSILNFYIATHASIFVGVQGSSWSTDVWNTRYHQGKGAGNYEYTKSFIRPLPDGGLPPPHQNCKEIKFYKH